MTRFSKRTVWIVIGKNPQGHYEVFTQFESKEEAESLASELRNAQNDLVVKIEEIESVDPDRTLPTSGQRKELGQMLHRVFVAIRSLAYANEPDRIAELADIFHNLPTEMFDEKNWDWNYLELSLDRFHKKHPKATSFNFAEMIREIRSLADTDDTE